MTTTTPKIFPIIRLLFCAKMQGLWEKIKNKTQKTLLYDRCPIAMGYKNIQCWRSQCCTRMGIYLQNSKYNDVHGCGLLPYM